MLMFAAAIVWGLSTRRLPVWMPVALMAVNVATFMAYWQDKYAASKKQWRTPEDALHIWSIAGGWPAAWLAQQLLRHKSNKASFLSVYWFTVFLNALLLGVWLWHDEVFLLFIER